MFPIVPKRQMGQREEDRPKSCGKRVVICNSDNLEMAKRLYYVTRVDQKERAILK